METKSYTRKDLNTFIHTGHFSQLENIPISKHRAVSQINNPRASDDDILLVVQFDEDKVVGYLGVLPDYIFQQDEYHKAGWLSCFWIDEDYKSRNIAANLFRRIIRTWDQRILITNLVPWTGPVYEKTGLFLPSQHKTGIRGYMRSNLSEILPPKGRMFKRITPLLKITDFVINIFGDVRFWFFKGYILSNSRCEHLNHIDRASGDFINGHNKNNWNQRGPAELEWIMNNPWILAGTEVDYNGSRYYFSSFSKSFFYQAVKFTDKQNNITGWALFCIRNSSITIPYVFSDPDHYDVISKMLVNTMLHMKLNMITTFNEEMVKSLNNLKPPFLYKKQIKRTYFISNKFDFIHGLNFQDGDGDCAFY
jgi:GNAT superfamily N-acetyltransferase